MSLETVWSRLAAVASLSFSASSSVSTGWNGNGSGDVVVTRPNDSTIVFNESGSWIAPSDRRIAFSNVYRWSQIPDTANLRLEHLRFGHTKPVYLFDLTFVGHTRLVSVDPHVCSDDLYSAELLIRETELHLNWSINGPKKNETICYVYW